MIELKENRLVFSFPEIHPKARCSVEFQRTLRLPDDNRNYPLPPGLGRFPLMNVDDLGAKIPQLLEKRGGVLLPMYQAEAMWIKFDADYPFAIKVAAGKINAVTGDVWSNKLHEDPQDYLVVPKQPWLDGFCVAKGKIRQFVAMPLGEGYTAEEQLTRSAEYGGIQIMAFPMTWETYSGKTRNKRQDNIEPRGHFFETRVVGLSPGGLMWQDIYEDDHNVFAWATPSKSRCFVHLVNSLDYQYLTGKYPPSPVISAKHYTQHGLPWFEYFDEYAPTLSGKAKLASLDSVAAMGIKKNEAPLPENESVEAAYHVNSLRNFSIREGNF